MSYGIVFLVRGLIEKGQGSILVLSTLNDGVMMNVMMWRYLHCIRILLAFK